MMTIIWVLTPFRFVGRAEVAMLGSIVTLALKKAAAYFFVTLLSTLELHGAGIQKNVITVFTAVRTSILTIILVIISVFVISLLGEL
jgi:hypothetical protein